MVTVNLRIADGEQPPNWLQGHDDSSDLNRPRHALEHRSMRYPIAARLKEWREIIGQLAVTHRPMSPSGSDNFPA
jgi:hypothetical protein